ncbi:chromate efflux transporter [Candidatus Micrarchaeota archaeon]|nr:chromate efflux transporter [Candidatus Micrarchaeota archaeon]
MAVPKLTQWQIFLRFLKFGVLAWGGPVAQIAMIRHELVEKEQWISARKFNRVLAVYQALPGPEATELSVYFGTLAGGRLGGLLAGLGFVLPGFILMLALSWLYVAYGLTASGSAFAAVFLGVQPAVTALIVRAVHRIGKHALFDAWLLVIAAVSCIGTLLGASFVAALGVATLAYVAVTRKHISAALALCGLFLLYSVTVFVQPVMAAAPLPNSLTHQASALDLFFSGLKAGLLTFGGAYTVIPFLQQDAVFSNGWLTHAQFLDGLALSGILPAPLIIFSTFVGFLTGSWWGALAMTFAIFLPAFAFTLVGHSYFEKAVEHPGLRSSLDGLTAGVVGLIAATAIGLLPVTIKSVAALLIFAGALLVLEKWNSAWAVPAVVVLSGVVGFLFLHT